MDEYNRNIQLSNEEKKYVGLLERCMRLINIYKQLEEIPKYFGTDELYYKLEIHTIYKIGISPGVNVTALASYLGISKSAVSQVIKKLEKKGAVERYQALSNKKEVLFRLTDKGEQAHIGHMTYHHKNDKEAIEELLRIPDEKLEAFKEVLEVFIKRGEKMIE